MKFRLYLLLAVFSSLCVTVYNTEIIKSEAKRFYDNAFTFLEKEETNKALASFRTAVRLDNSSYLYWNDLGVTEMRVGQLQKAYKRFKRSLELKSSFSVAKKNLDEIVAYFSSEKSHLSELKVKEILSSPLHRKLYPENQKHEIRTIPSFSQEEFQQILINKIQTKADFTKFLSKPFLVKGYLTVNDKIRTFLELSSLSQRYGMAKVDFYPHNMIEEQTKPFYKPLYDAINQLIEPSEIYVDVDISEEGSYLQWNLTPSLYFDLLNQTGLTIPYLFHDNYLLEENPNCFGKTSEADTVIAQRGEGAQQPVNVQRGEELQSKRITDIRTNELITAYYLKTHWKMLLIGEKGSGMFNHQDTLLSPTYQVLLTGIKQWHLCSNVFSSFLYKAGDVNLFSPNYELFPNILKVKCYQFNQSEGDLLYYPGNYWHQTVNFVTPTIGLTGTFITERTLTSLIEELTSECEGAARLFVKEERY
jgi:hypothetical protein